MSMANRILEGIMKKSSIFIALAIVTVAIIWVASGLIFNGNAENKTSTDVSQSAKILEKIPEVRVERIFAQKMSDTLDITGRTQASQSVVVKSETQGRIRALHFDKGDLVEAGQLLVELEINDRAAKVEEARQLVNQRRIQYNAAKELEAQGYNSKIRLSEALAQLELAKAQLKQAQIDLGDVNITAPFSGVINDKMVELGDYVQTGGDIAHLVQLNPIEVKGFATEKQIHYLTDKLEISSTLLNGESLKGYLSFIAAAADEDTRTFAFEATMKNENISVKDGLTATIHIPMAEDRAYQIPSSVLSLADDGTVGVKIVNEYNEVVFVPINVIKDNQDYIWVTGLTHESALLITVGQAFVTTGQQVKPVEAGSLVIDLEK